MMLPFQDSIHRTLPAIVVMMLAWALQTRGETPDPYRLLPASDATKDTAAEPFRNEFSRQAAAACLDEHAHLAEKSCYACHSTFTFMTARSLIDPLADQVMQTRVMMERFTARCLDPKELPKIKTQHIAAVRLLTAVELARHDAATTGKLHPLTRGALDALWSTQLPDGGFKWLHVGEAPQAIDDWWPVTMVALGVSAAPENYAQTDKATLGTEKLRGWFRAHPAKTNHERGLSLIAHSAIGDVLSETTREQYIAALLGAQHEDGGWSLAGLAPWQRPDKAPLDSVHSDGYGTGFSTYALARAGLPASDARLRKAIDWLKRNQRRTGGWFTPSPFKRDKLASNTGASFAIQALAACGELTPPRSDEAAFAAAHAAAEKALGPEVFLPNSSAAPTPSASVPPKP